MKPDFPEVRDPAALFRRYALKRCPDLRLCGLIANWAKHLQCRSLDQPSPFATVVRSAEVRFVDDKGEALKIINDVGDEIGWTSNAWELWVRTETGERRRAAEVLEAALHWWIQFVYGNQVDERQEPIPNDLR